MRVACRPVLVLFSVCVFATSLHATSGSRMKICYRQPNGNENYKIGPGDVIDVIVSKNERLSRAGLRVNNKERFSFAMMDTDMPAACLTERQLADAVKEKYEIPCRPVCKCCGKEFNSNPSRRDRGGKFPWTLSIEAVNPPG